MGGLLSYEDGESGIIGEVMACLRVTRALGSSERFVSRFTGTAGEL